MAKLLCGQRQECLALATLEEWLIKWTDLAKLDKLILWLEKRHYLHLLVTGNPFKKGVLHFCVKMKKNDIVICLFIYGFGIHRIDDRL